MEKLIELLNEYNWQDSYWLDEDSISKGKYINRWSGDQCFVNEHIISKRFGFIKRLVDNDKIDKKKIDTRLVRYVESHYDEEWYWVENSYEDYELYECLLMLLAISDTPIEDLCSYLK